MPFKVGADIGTSKLDQSSLRCTRKLMSKVSLSQSRTVSSRGEFNRIKERYKQLLDQSVARSQGREGE